jgi:hypothetical protein
MRCRSLLDTPLNPAIMPVLNGRMGQCCLAVRSMRADNETLAACGFKADLSTALLRTIIEEDESWQKRAPAFWSR